MLPRNNPISYEKPGQNYDFIFIKMETSMNGQVGPVTRHINKFFA